MVVPVDDWQLIDGTIDNAVAVEVVGGDHHSVELGMRIREVGWAQTRRHPKISGAAGGGLPVDDHLTITLEVDAWIFIAEQLRRWAVVSDGLAQGPRWSEVEREEFCSSDAQARRVADWITRRLSENTK